MSCARLFHLFRFRVTSYRGGDALLVRALSGVVTGRVMSKIKNTYLCGMISSSCTETMIDKVDVTYVLEISMGEIKMTGGCRSRISRISRVSRIITSRVMTPAT